MNKLKTSNVVNYSVIFRKLMIFISLNLYDFNFKGVKVLKLYFNILLSSRPKINIFFTEPS